MRAAGWGGGGGGVVCGRCEGPCVCVGGLCVWCGRHGCVKTLFLQLKEMETCAGGLSFGWMG